MKKMIIYYIAGFVVSLVTFCYVGNITFLQLLAYAGTTALTSIPIGLGLALLSQGRDLPLWIFSLVTYANCYAVALIWMSPLTALAAFTASVLVYIPFAHFALSEVGMSIWDAFRMQRDLNL